MAVAQNKSRVKRPHKKPARKRVAPKNLPHHENPVVKYAIFCQSFFAKFALTKTFSEESEYLYAQTLEIPESDSKVCKPKRLVKKRHANLYEVTGQK